MKKFTIVMSLLAMMMLTVSCTKDSDAKDDISKNFTDFSKPESGDRQDQPGGKGDTGPQGEKADNDNGDRYGVYNIGQYYYFGTWRINDAVVEPDILPDLWNEYLSQRFNSNPNKPYYPSGEYNYVCLKTSSEGSYMISFSEFPIKQIIHDILPEIDIAYITYNAYSSLYSVEQDKLNVIAYYYTEKEGVESVSEDFSIFLNPSGQSENALYFEFRGSDKSTYIHLPVVVTTRDGVYLGISFNVVSRKSILVYDRQTGMITLSLMISSIDKYEKTGKTTQVLNMDNHHKYTVTFTSNAKKDKINLGN